MSFSLMNIVKENFKNYDDFKIFEVGTIIANNENKKMLSVILAGDDRNLETSYNEAKKVIKYLFRVFKNKDVVLVDNVNEKVYYDDSLGKNIMVDNKKMGELNVLARNFASKLARKKSVVCVDIDFKELVELEKEKVVPKMVSKYPSVSLDYTVSLGEVKYRDLEKVLEEFKSKLINKYELIGQFKDKYTIRYTLGSDNKTLDQKDLQTFKERFMSYIKEAGFSIEM